MTSTNPPKRHTNQSRTGVRAPYTYAKLKDDLMAGYQPNTPQKSLRALAARYGVSHGAIQRAMSGKEPKSKRIRRAFGLTDLVQVAAVVCDGCGVAHIKSAPCPNRQRKYKSLFDWPIKALAQAIRERR